MTIEEKLAKLKKDVTEFENLKLQVSARVNSYEEEKTSLLSECAALSVEPSCIEKEITAIETLMDREIEQVRIALGQVNVTTR